MNATIVTALVTMTLPPVPHASATVVLNSLNEGDYVGTGTWDSDYDRCDYSGVETAIHLEEGEGIMGFRLASDEATCEQRVGERCTGWTDCRRMHGLGVDPVVPGVPPENVDEAELDVSCTHSGNFQAVNYFSVRENDEVASSELSADEGLRDRLDSLAPLPVNENAESVSRRILASVYYQGDAAWGCDDGDPTLVGAGDCGPTEDYSEYVLYSCKGYYQPPAGPSLDRVSGHWEGKWCYYSDCPFNTVAELTAGLVVVQTEGVHCTFDGGNEHYCWDLTTS